MSGFGQPPAGGGGFGQPPAGGGGFGAPPGAGMPGQPGGFGAPGGAPAGPPPGDQPNFVLWMILAIVSAVVCQGWLTGIPAFVLALLANQEWSQGQYESAQGKLKWSKIITIIGFVLMGLGILAYVLLMVIGVGMAAATAPASY